MRVDVCIVALGAIGFTDSSSDIIFIKYNIHIHNRNQSSYLARTPTRELTINLISQYFND